MHHDIEVRWIKLREAQALLEANENEFEWMVNHKDFPPVADIDGDYYVQFDHVAEFRSLELRVPNEAGFSSEDKND